MELLNIKWKAIEVTYRVQTGSNLRPCRDKEESEVSRILPVTDINILLVEFNYRPKSRLHAGFVYLVTNMVWLFVLLRAYGINRRIIDNIEE